MSNLRMAVFDQLADEAEVSSLLKNGSVASEDEVREGGLEIVGQDEMRRRLQSRTAKEHNRVDHVANLYRNRTK